MSHTQVSWHPNLLEACFGCFCSQECPSSACPWGVDICCPRAFPFFFIHTGRGCEGIHQGACALWQGVSSQTCPVECYEILCFLLYNKFLESCNLNFCGSEWCFFLVATVFNLFSFCMILILWFSGTCRHFPETHLLYKHVQREMLDARDSWGWPDPDPACRPCVTNPHTHMCSHSVALVHITPNKRIWPASHSVELCTPPAFKKD